MQRIPSEEPTDDILPYRRQNTWYDRRIRNTSIFRLLRKKWAYVTLCFFICMVSIYMLWLRGYSYTYRTLTGPSPGTDRYLSKSFFQNVFSNPVPLADIDGVNIPKASYIPRLHISCVLYDADHLSIKIRDAERDRYEVPMAEPYPHPVDPTFPDLAASNFAVIVETDPLKLQIMRRSTGEILFDLDPHLIYTDLYIEFSFSIPTEELYGFGERFAPLQMRNGTYSLYILDRKGEVDRGIQGFNSQGHHPMYLNREASGLYHIMFFRNVNNQEIVIKNDRTMVWKAIGGIIDLNFFVAETPEGVIERYHKYLGGWTLPALWHLGSHQCKWWGYRNNTHVKEILDGYLGLDIPLDGMWLDIDLFKSSINLLVDKENYPEKEFRKMYQDYRKKFVTVVQAYLPVQAESPVWGYPDAISLTFRDGRDTSESLKGHEISGDVYFIDHQNPKAEDFWFRMLDELSQSVPLSGVWEDANEPTDLSPWNFFRYSANRKYYNLPFYPGGKNFYDEIMVPLDAVHFDGSEEYNVRAFNCFFQSMQSFNYFKSRNFSQPFVLSRATVFGIGKYAYHFVPDISSTWEAMRISLPSIMNLNILGMPMTGSDICGMGGDLKTPPELCARWYQSAVFYPFARNHHSPLRDVDNFQEPFRYSGIYVKAIRKSILLRYSLLKQLQALFFQKKGFGTVFKPLFLEFWNDTTMPQFGSQIHEEQFLVGTFIMSSPVLFENTSIVTAFFPNCRWYDLRDYSEIPVRGMLYNVSARLDEDVPYYLRGGFMLFKQDVSDVLVSDDLSNIFYIIVGLDTFTIADSTRVARADGFILNAAHSDENYIYSFCIIHDCMLKVQVLYREYFHNHTINIDFRGEGTGQDAERRVIINQIDILGVSADMLKADYILACENCNGYSYVELAPAQGFLRLRFKGLSLGHGVRYNFVLSSA